MDYQIYLSLGKKLKDLRLLNQLTQEELGTKLGLSRTSINNIENGRHRIQLHILFAYSNIFNVSINELLLIDG